MPSGAPFGPRAPARQGETADVPPGFAERTVRRPYGRVASSWPSRRYPCLRGLMPSRPRVGAGFTPAPTRFAVNTIGRRLTGSTGRAMLPAKEILRAVPELTHLRSYEHLKLVADPRRLAILQHLMSAPATLTQLGQALGEHPAWIRHHLRRLEDAGLVDLVETRRVHGAEERYYRARAGGYLLQELILPQTSGRPVIVFCGSHDLAVERLAAELAPYVDVLTLPVGSLNGLANLRLGLGHLAGCHLLDPQGEYNQSFVRALFPDRPVHLITLAHRVQGLMLAVGNPKRIRTLSDLARPDITFLNRNPGSGTRLWLDRQLEPLGILPSAIHGYDRSVNTHTACAVAIANGEADAALGLQAAAAAHGLAFAPLFHERYDLVVPHEQLSTVGPLMDRLNDGEFRRWAESLTGYEMAHAGEEILL